MLINVGLPTEENLEIDGRIGMVWYLVMRAADVFFSTHHYYPGNCGLNHVYACLRSLGRGKQRVSDKDIQGEDRLHLNRPLC